MPLTDTDLATTRPEEKTSADTPRFRWLAPSPGRRELIAAAVATTVSMAIVTYLGRNTWFFADSWDFLDRDLTSPSTLLAPHNGHLQFPVAVTHQMLYAVFQFDFWPWYFLPRVVGYGLMAYAAWYVLRRRATEPAVAWIALAYLLFLGSSTFLTAATIGHHFVIPAIALIAAMYDASGPRRGRDQVWFTLLLGVIVISTSLGVAAAAALGLVALLTGRLWRVLPSFAIVGALYLTWYFGFPRQGGGSLDVTVDGLLGIPMLAWDMLAPALARNLTLPLEFGPALVVGAVITLAWWLARGRLTTFDAVWVTTAGVYVAMVILLRVLPGRATIDSPRYGYVLVWLLIFVVAPHIRLPSDITGRRMIVVGLFALVGVGNVDTLVDSFGTWEARADTIRERAETVGALLVAGEPGESGAHMDIAHGRELTVERIQGFLDDGWEPRLSDDPAAVEAARGVMRLESTTLPSHDLDDCVRVAVGASVAVMTGPDSRIVIQGQGLTTLAIEWRDEFGLGTRTIEFRGRRTLLYPAGADATVELTLEDGNRLTVCAPDLAV